MEIEACLFSGITEGCKAWSPAADPPLPGAELPAPAALVLGAGGGTGCWGGTVPCRSPSHIPLEVLCH